MKGGIEMSRYTEPIIFFILLYMAIIIFIR